MRSRPLLLGLPALLCAIGCWHSFSVLRGTLRSGHAFAALLGRAYVPILVLLVAAMLLCAAATVLLAREMVRARTRPTLARVRLAVYVAIAWWALHSIAGLPVALPMLQLTSALAFGAYAMLLLVAPLVASRGIRRWLQPVDLVLANVAALLVFGEAALRVALWATGSSLLDPAIQTPVERIASRRKEGLPTHYGFPLNSMGYMDTEFVRRPGRRAIASIGDSFALGTVHHHYHFTTVCERELGDTDVFNLGLPGIGPDEYLHLLREEALRLRPDAIQINLFLGNDLRDFHGDEAGPRDVRRWFTIGELLVFAVPARVAVMARERRLSERIGAPQGFEAPPPATEWDAAQIAERFPWFEHVELEKPTFSEAAFLDLETRRVRTACLGPRSRFEEFELQIERLVAAAGSIPIFFVLIPDEFQVEDALWNRLLEGSADLRARKVERQRPQRILAEWFAARRVLALDLLPALRAVAPMEDGRRHVYLLQDTHFNARGNRIAGEAIAAFVREKL